MFFLVTNGTEHAHGDTLKEAKDALQYKAEQRFFKSEPITPETLINIPRYRAITGACETGCNLFIDDNFDREQAKVLRNKGLPASDIIQVLEKRNAYGFAAFKKVLQNG